MATWLAGAVHDFFWPQGEYVVRIVAAVVLGGLIGAERELRDKPAGLRTIILICVGACVFTIASEVIGGRDADTTRIAAQVVTGIGFLGAGAIIRDRQAVFGLTTAATIWAVAAIGTATGFGLLALAGFGTLVILIALLIFNRIEEWVGRYRDIQDYHIATAHTDDALDRVAALFREANVGVRKRMYYEEGPSLVIHIVAMGAKANHERLRRRLARSEDYTLRAPT